MESDEERWNRRYAEQGLTMGSLPAPFLAENLPLILSLIPGRRALDMACGEGRNSIFLARHGFRVTALDISRVGLAKGREWAEREGVTIDWVQADLASCQLGGPYDLILNINYLQRELFGAAVAALVPGGIMLVETILGVAGAPGPTNPLHLLERGELEQFFPLEKGDILYCGEFPRAAVPVARLIFCRKDTTSGPLTVP
jgi:2-polyprenyl-3-methyl-5-hydroxy-6-metoxy-1,4-benzoquinol methylase